MGINTLRWKIAPYHTFQTLWKIHTFWHYAWVICAYFPRNRHNFLYCVLKKWVHYRIGQCVRPAVYTITLQGDIRLWWNFAHRIVSSTSRSSSKMRLIPQEIAELSQKLSLFQHTMTQKRANFIRKCFFDL